MKLILTSILLLAACTGSVVASAINWGHGGARGSMFVTNDAARIAAGSLVRVGYLATAGNLSTFTEFATTTISHPASTVPVGGFLTNPATNATVAPANASKQIFIWVYNAPTAAAATQAGIFTNEAWLFPATWTGSAAESFNVNLILPVAGTSAIPDPVTGGIPTVTVGPIELAGTTNQTGTIYTLGGAPIPEPSSIGLIALVGLTAIRRRR